MITLTDPAVAAIRRLAAAPGSGLRIVHADGSGSLTLSVAPGPEEGDQVLEHDGARVFLPADVVAMLGDSGLDALTDELGVAFRVLVTEPS